MSANSDGRNEWLALAECHFERVKCEARCIGIMEQRVCWIKGKTYVADLNQATENLKGALSMIVQYCGE